jgi:lysophospholipase L1-like esterase
VLAARPSAVDNRGVFSHQSDRRPGDRSVPSIRGISCLLAAAVVSLAPWARGEQPAFLPAARVAIVGDSITEQKLYSKYVECWLLACSGLPDVRVMQFGWSGEKADGFAKRADNDLGVFDPTVVTLCYGMNDGGYQPWKEEIGQTYDKNMRQVLDRLAALGVKTVVVGSPGAVDTDFFRPGQMMGDRPSNVAYNDTLAHLRDIDRTLASEKGHRFADVHGTMIDAMAKAKASLGPKYDVCGGDGFHPGPNGQLLMAYAFLKGLGVDGSIATIDVDAASGTATATPGQRVVGVGRQVGRGVAVELESRRWPFCFEGDGRTSKSTRSIVPFVPFNDDLNRYMLAVKGLDAPKAKVTWGEESKEFTKEQLNAGINLAAEFPRTPFDGAFASLDKAVGEKQAFETFMIKQVVTGFRQIPGVTDDPKIRDATNTIGDGMMRRWEEREKKVRDALVPVKHTITIEPLAG